MQEQPPVLMESVCLLDNTVPLLSLHQERINRSRLSLYGIKKQLSLQDFLGQQTLPSEGRFKLRLTYDRAFRTFECIPYRIRSIHTLRIIEVNQFNYRHKYADRQALHALKAQSEQCDDILISYRGFLTDSSFANIALFDGRKWWTPAHPLLKGVRREHLCRTGQLKTSVIRTADLGHFKEMRLINAMIGLEESPSIYMDDIYLKS